MKSKKILELEDLKEVITKNNYKISLVHGVFDIIHVGHKRYFEEAKSLSEKLVVSITADKFVNKGPNRPIFNHNLRAEIVSSFECVDFVILSQNETAVNIINKIKPNFYVKGNDYKDLSKDVTKNIYKEKAAVEKNKGKLVFTNDIQFSSSNIINSFYKPENVLNELKKLKINKKKLSDDCSLSLKKIEDLKVCIIGEIIFDEYVFSDEMERPSKENIHAVNYRGKELYCGGTVAVAKNLSNFCKKIDLFSAGSLNTEYNSKLKNIKKNCKNVNFFIDKSDYQTIKKTRILNEMKKKIFEIYKKKGSNIYKPSKKFMEEFKKKLKLYDVVILCDYGHGFFNKNIYKLIKKNSKIISINAQTNSDNRGFNLITKYNYADVICIDEPEIRLALSDKTSSIENMAKKLIKKIKFKILVVTKGHSGISVFSKNNKNLISKISLSAFEVNPTDTIGAGDSVLGITSLLSARNSKPEIIAYLGNIFGALTTKYLGHSSQILKKDVSKAISYSLK